MAKAYTPGLYVSDRTVVDRERMLPLEGEVVVDQGDRLRAEDIVARTDLPGAISTMNVANRIGCDPALLPSFMTKDEGDKIEQGEVILKTSPPLGLDFLDFLSNEITAPIDGSIQSISEVTGQVIFQEKPIPVEVTAFVDGVVSEVREGQGVVMQTVATYIQGIFGVSGEVTGPLKVAVESPEEHLDPEDVDDRFEGKIVVVGSFCPFELWEALLDVGAIGVITGGFNDRDLRQLLGKDLGVAITGTEELGMTLVVTEGFGDIRMAQKTFELLRQRDGSRASISGATQIRAGVIRPEIIVPYPDLIGEHLEDGHVEVEEPEAGDEIVGEVHGEAQASEEEMEQAGTGVGTMIRVIREPWFGRLGEITGMPTELQQVESETKVRVFEVEFENGETALVPRANVEAIEE